MWVIVLCVSSSGCRVLVCNVFVAFPGQTHLHFDGRINSLINSDLGLCIDCNIALHSVSTRENLTSGVNEQQKRRPACASAQSDQRHCHSLLGKYNYLDFLRAKF